MCKISTKNTSQFDQNLSEVAFIQAIQYALLSKGIFLCPVHSIFRFSLFGQSDQKRKNQLSCLYIFCIKNLHFAWNSYFFCVFWLLTKKRKMKWTRHWIAFEVLEIVWWMNVTSKGFWPDYFEALTAYAVLEIAVREGRRGNM